MVRVTRRFWEKRLPDFDAVISSVVLREILDTPDSERRREVGSLVAYLVSWNFSHLVKVQTRREVNLVNALEGYDPIEIVAPPEL